MGNRATVASADWATLTPLATACGDGHDHRMPAFASLALVLCVPPLVAQPSERVNPTEVRRLDLEGQRAQSGFLEQLDTIAEGYEKAGAIDRAKETMKFRLRIEKDDAVTEKLAELEERRFDNETELKLDASGTWFNTGLDLTAGQEVRISATGDYRLMSNQTVGPAGVQPGDAVSGYQTEFPLGALIGTVFPPAKTPERGQPTRRPNTRPGLRGPSQRPRQPQRDESKRPEPSPPQAIGAEATFTPSIDGRLFLKLNLPPTATAAGSLTVTVAGPFQAGR